MESIRIKRAEEDLYRINIAEDGSEIVFDLADISLPIRCQKAFDEVEANKNKATSKISVIEKEYVNQEMNKKLEDQKQMRIWKVYDEMYKDNRRVMNELFNSKDAMDKLFGDANYIDMYNDLFEQLEPHFKKMKLNMDKVKERIIKKYANKDIDVLK